MNITPDEPAQSSSHELHLSSPPNKRPHTAEEDPGEDSKEKSCENTPSTSSGAPPPKLVALEVKTDSLTTSQAIATSSPVLTKSPTAALPLPKSSNGASVSPKKSSRHRNTSGPCTSDSDASISPDKSWRAEEDSLTGAGGGAPSRHSGDSERALRDEARKSEERRLMALISHFQEDQLSRFEDYRRASFPKTGIRRLMQSVSSCPISQNVVIAMSGIAKVFVGEIIEEALTFKESIKEENALQPKHIREAVRRLKDKDLIPHGKPSKNPLL